MLTSNKFAEQVQDWIRDTEQMLAARSQLTARGVVLIFGMATVLCVALLVQIFIDNRPRPYMGLIATLMISLSMLVWVRYRKRIPPRALLLVCTAIVINHLIGVLNNGVPPLFLNTTILVMVHLLLNPNPALGLGVLLILGTQAIAWVAHPEISHELLARLLIVNLGALGILQSVTRYWRNVALGFRDISKQMIEAQSGGERELHDAQDRLESTLYTDEATGLPNRAGFMRDLQTRLDSLAAMQSVAIATCLIDSHGDTRTPLDLRAIVNLIATGLQSQWPGSVEIVGIGDSNEFFVLLSASAVGRPSWETQLQAAIASQIALSGVELRRLRVPRIGIALWPADGKTAEILLTRAELSKDVAKSLSTAVPVRFDVDMESFLERQARLLADIERGLSHGEFELFYQPIVSTVGGLQKAEALIRWNHPTRGRVPPAEFMSVAERSALVIEITDRVLKMASRQVRRWRRDLNPDFQVSVNIPASYLQSFADDPRSMLARLQALKIPPQSIILEITEGALLEVDEELLRALTLLRDQGFLLALDDFGSGYSSFGGLPRLPLDFLKLDKSFVDSLVRGASAEAVCATIVALSHDLGTAVVAEGVEHQSQFLRLVDMEVNFVQGYLFSRPLPVPEFVAWASSRTA